MSPLGLSPLKFVVVAVLAIGLTVGGAFALGVVGTPDVVGVDNSFGPVDEAETVIESDLLIHNPNPIGLTLGGVTIEYEIRLNEIPMANGTREGVAVERGNSTVPFETTMDNDRIPDWWVSHLRNGEFTTLTVHADIHSAFADRTVGAPTVEREIETDLVEAFNSDEDRELEANSAVVPDPVLVVRETRGEWGAVSQSTTEIRMELDLYNPREFPIVLSEIGYDVAMNDVEMGDGETDRSVVIPPGEERTVAATFRLDNANLDEWWVTHLQNAQTTTLTADFYVRVNLSEGGGDTVRIPLDTMEQTIETDIFGERETDDDTDGADGDNSTDGGDSTDRDGDDADAETTPTEEGTETPTEEETETPSDGDDEEDDGGILPVVGAGSTAV